MARNAFKHSCSCLVLDQVKEEGWWLVLGDVDTHELLALKRISFADHTTARLTFPVINGAGREMAGVTLFFMSDSYLGLDQQYFVPVPGKQQSRHMSAPNGVQQSQNAKAEDANSASGHHNKDRNVEDVSKAVGQMSLNKEQDSAANAVVEHEAKGQRSNARRQRG